MIRLLAPISVDTADDQETLIVEMNRPIFLALAAGVQIAFEDCPPDFEAAGEELWRFFVRGEETPA